MGEEMCFGRQYFKISFAHLFRQGLIGYFIIYQCSPHPFPSQFFSVDIPFAKTIPIDGIVVVICLMEMFKIIGCSFTKLHFDIEIFQCLVRVGLKVPQSMIKIKENLFVLLRHLLAKIQQLIKNEWKDALLPFH